MSAFEFSGSGHLPVGSPFHWWDNPPECTHTGRNVCQICAELTDDEAQAIREYVELLKARRGGE